jgi:hypothetical protein
MTMTPDTAPETPMPAPERDNPDLAALGRRIMRKADVMRLDAKASNAAPALIADLQEIYSLGRIIAKIGGDDAV